MNAIAPSTAIETIVSTSIKAIGAFEMVNCSSLMTGAEMVDFYSNPNWEIKLRIEIQHSETKETSTFFEHVLPIFAIEGFRARVQIALEDLLRRQLYDLKHCTVEKLPEGFEPMYREYLELLYP